MFLEEFESLTALLRETPSIGHPFRRASHPGIRRLYMPRSNYWINSSTVVPGLAEFIEYEDADDDDEPEDKPKEKKSVMETIGDVMKEPIGVMAAQMVTKAAGKYVDAFAAVLRMLKQEAGAERRRGDGSE